MACGVEYVEFVCDVIHHCGAIRYRKMFGDCMIYVDDKPLLLLCDDVTYVKKLAEITELMQDAEVGIPYQGAKEHYILDVENRELCESVIAILKSVVALPKQRKKQS